MKLKLKLVLICCLYISILLSDGCSAWENAYEQAGSSSFRVVSIKGPSALGFIKAMEPEIKPTVRLGDTVQYTFEEDENKLYAQISEGNADIAVVPTEMAAKLYNEGAGYRLAAVNSGGYFYVVSAGEKIASISDLNGKVVHVAQENSAADLVFRYLLMRNNIEQGKDITLIYTENEEALVKDAVSEKISLMVLPEPWVSDLLSKNDGFNIALDIQDEWGKITGTAMSLPQTCLIVKDDIVSPKNDAWKLFLEDYQDSIEWVNSNTVKTSELLDHHEVGIPKELAEQVIPRSNLGYSAVLSSKPAVEKYLQIFFELSPGAIGGKLPDKEFYYEK